MGVYSIILPSSRTTKLGTISLRLIKIYLLADANESEFKSSHLIKKARNFSNKVYFNFGQQPDQQRFVAR